MNELFDKLLTIICERIEGGDIDEAANHCGILLEHFCQDGASDATLARSVGRLDDIRRARAKQ